MKKKKKKSERIKKAQGAYRTSSSELVYTWREVNKEKRGKGIEGLFKEIMAERIPYLEKEASWFMKSKNSRKIVP